MKEKISEKNKNLSPLHKNEKKISEKHFFVGAP